MTVAATLEFRLAEWERDARTLATCVSCYGVGEDRDAPGRACPACKGSGRAPREPHVLELVDLLRRREAELLEERHARAEQADRAFAAEARAAACEEAVETRSAMLAQVEALAAARHAAEEEGDALRLEVDRLRGEAYRLRDELNRARRQERDE